MSAKRGRGRPKKESKVRQVSIALEPDTLEQAKAASAHDGRSLSSYVRNLILRDLRNRKRRVDAPA